MNISNLLKNRKILFVIVLFIMASIIMVIVSILNNRKYSENISRESYTDPISGETITDPRVTTGGASASKYEPAFIGVNQLLDHGVTKSQINDIKKSIAEYYYSKEGKSGSLILSYYKDSYKKKSEEYSSVIEYSMKIAINNDQNNNIFLKLSNKGVENYDIILYSDESLTNEVYKYSFCSILICKPEAPKSNTVYPNGYAG